MSVPVRRHTNICSIRLSGAGIMLLHMERLYDFWHLCRMILFDWVALCFWKMTFDFGTRSEFAHIKTTPCRTSPAGIWLLFFRKSSCRSLVNIEFPFGINTLEYAQVVLDSCSYWKKRGFFHILVNSCLHEGLKYSSLVMALIILQR